MADLTPTERRVLLTLFKEFNTNYNANLLAKKLEISRFGAGRVLKDLEKQSLVVSREYGKARFHKVNLEEEYARKVIEVLLMGEVRKKARRWIWEFREWYKDIHVAIIFGSAPRNYKEADDIDMVLVVDKKFWKKRKDFIEKKNQILLKPLHPIWQSPNDLVKNLTLPDPVLLSALKFGYILHGYQEVIEAVRLAQNTYGLFAVPKPESR